QRPSYRTVFPVRGHAHRGAPGPPRYGNRGSVRRTDFGQGRRSFRTGGCSAPGYCASFGGIQHGVAPAIEAARLFNARSQEARAEKIRPERCSQAVSVLQALTFLSSAENSREFRGCNRSFRVPNWFLVCCFDPATNFALDRAREKGGLWSGAEASDRTVTEEVVCLQ